MRNSASLLPNPGATATPGLHKADLHLLAVFMTVTQCGGFAAAQVALNVSQSVISRKIGDLERGLGMRLCQRGRAGFNLTDKGRVVYEACEHLSTALESFRTTVGALQGELVGDLSIAAIDNWATERGYPMADVLRAFRSKASRVHIHFHTLAPDEIERAVLDNRANLGIGVFHQHRPGLLYEALYDDPVELYCGVGHALFERAPNGIDQDDLHAADLVHRAYLSERQVAPLTAGLGSSATARQIEGVAFLDPLGFAHRLSAGRLRRTVGSERAHAQRPARDVPPQHEDRAGDAPRGDADAGESDLCGSPARDHGGVALLSAGLGALLRVALEWCGSWRSSRSSLTAGPCTGAVTHQALTHSGVEFLAHRVARFS